MIDWHSAWIQSLLIIVGTILLAFLARIIIEEVLQRIVTRTRTDLDDHFLKAVKKPIFVTILIIGFHISFFPLSISSAIMDTVQKVVYTLVILVWIQAGMRFGTNVVEWLFSRKKEGSVELRTKPLLTLIIKISVFLLGGYLILMTWGKNATALLTSASVIGLVFGFAARDSLANLFSGVFIMADAPYKIGDYIVLGSGERGRVTDIGLRSTRLLTRDEVEIIIPNAVIGADKIINQSGGPSTKFRVRASTSVAYGSDIDKVRDVLMSVAINEPLAQKAPEPRVRFVSFGDSGLNFDVLVWVDPPEYRGQLLDHLNCGIYKALNEANIEIPFPQVDLHVKSTMEEGKSDT